MIEMVSNKPHVFDGIAREPGDRFEARSDHAKLLKLLGRASPVEVEAAPVVQAAPKKRTYKRRDMNTTAPKRKYRRRDMSAEA